MENSHSNSRDANVALLIDADNARPDALDPVLTVLAEFGTVNIRRIYGNWQKQALSGWADMVHRYAIEPQQQFDIVKGKNATDMKMTIDAMDLLNHGRVDGFGLMSSDSDFMPLAMRIRQEGVPVYGFGNPTTPEPFRQACTRFIDVTELIRTVEEEPKTDSPSIDADLMKLLDEAYKAAKRDDRGFARLSQVGQLAANRSSFDVRNFGYRRLSDLIKALPDNFATEERDGALFVRRLR